MNDTTKKSANVLKGRLFDIGRCLCDGARLMVGVPNYDTYVAHVRATHPDKPVMTYEEFFRDRQNAKFGGGGKGGFVCC